MASETLILTVAQALLEHEPADYRALLAYMNTSARVRDVCLEYLRRLNPTVSWIASVGPCAPANASRVGFDAVAAVGANTHCPNRHPRVPWEVMVDSIARTNPLCAMLAFTYDADCQSSDFLDDVLVHAIDAGNLALVRFLYDAASCSRVFWRCARHLIMREDGIEYARVLFNKETFALTFDRDDHEVEHCGACHFVSWVCVDLVRKGMFLANERALAYMLEYVMIGARHSADCALDIHESILSTLGYINECPFGHVILRAIDARVVLRRVISEWFSEPGVMWYPCITRMLRDRPDAVDERAKKHWTRAIVMYLGAYDTFRCDDIARELGMTREEGALRVIRSIASVRHWLSATGTMVEPLGNMLREFALRDDTFKLNRAFFARIRAAIEEDFAPYIDEPRAEYLERRTSVIKGIIAAFVHAGAFMRVRGARGIHIYRWIARD